LSNLNKSTKINKNKLKLIDEKLDNKFENVNLNEPKNKDINKLNINNYKKDTNNIEEMKTSLDDSNISIIEKDSPNKNNTSYEQELTKKLSVNKNKLNKTTE
jgi:hypothetical protein